MATKPVERIAADMEALSAVRDRFAGTEGEREALHVVRALFPEDLPTRIEGFVANVSPAFFSGMHAGLLVLGGIIGFRHPLIGAFLCGLVTLSLMGEGTGRFSLLRRWFRKTASYNLVSRLPSAEPLGAIVFSAPLDVPTWRPLKRRWMRWRPLQLVFAAALVVLALLVLRTLAEPWGPRTLEIYVVALMVLAIAMSLGAIAHRSGEGADEGSGPAVVLELVRRLREHPVPHVDTWFAFTGCGHSFQGGMDAFLALHTNTLAEPCLVVACDEPGRPPLRAVVSEGALWAQHHRPTGPALVERLRWAKVMVPALDRGGATDARAALVRGYRAIAFTGGHVHATPEAVAHAADVIETLVRWYGEDLTRVADTATSLEAMAKATTESRRPKRKAPAQPPPDEKVGEAS